jgi:bifunctional DNA-binding transcriptional regulator/antitoxin component of YhaV-PrlF toxin-antitoxin module
MMTIESIYKKEDIFKNVNEEEGTVDMIIPDDVKTRMGWKPGDILVFKVLENGGLEITKKPMFEKDVDETEK